MHGEVWVPGWMFSPCWMGQGSHLVVRSELLIESIKIEIPFFMTNNMYMSFTIIHISLHSLMQEFDSRVPRREAVQYWLRCPSHRDARANCTTSLLGTPESNSYTTERKPIWIIVKDMYMLFVMKNGIPIFTKSICNSDLTTKRPTRTTSTLHVKYDICNISGMKHTFDLDSQFNPHRILNAKYSSA